MFFGIASDDKLIQKNIIDESLSQEEKELSKSKIETQIQGILNNNCFSKSENYNQEYAIMHLSKMIDILGPNEAENILKIPEDIQEGDLQAYSNKLLEVYEPKYILKGALPITISIIENIDTYIAKQSKDVKNTRNKFFTEFNNILENNQDISFLELLKKCAEASGLEINESMLSKIKTELQTRQFTNKKDDILEKIKQKLDNPETQIIQRGVTSSLIYNVIRKNILNDGKIEDIDEFLVNELNRKREDGELYYGSSILEQKELILNAIKELYIENTELLNTNLIDSLKAIKQKVGNRWISRLRTAKNGIGDLYDLSEEEKEAFITKLQEVEIETKLEFDKNYQLKAGISKEKAYEILSEVSYPELLTYEKAEMMFSKMREPYSKEFGEWFARHKEEIMKNPDYYSNIATLHNEFSRLLENSNTRSAYDNKKLSVKGVFELLKNQELHVREGNEELEQIARSLTMETRELKEAEEIFELTKKREKNYIPQIKTTQKRYRGRILRADDPMNVLAGNATDCCQAVGDVGQAAMMHGATENNGRIFVVEQIDENGKVIKLVAQSWVWRNKDRLCFDNIEIPVAEHADLKDGELEYQLDMQKEILQIYKDCAEKILVQDEKLLKSLLEKGKITEDIFNSLVLKDITVGVGYNDLGILKTAGLEVVPEAEMIFPRETNKRYDTVARGKMAPWVDSGISSVRGEGAQLYLAKSGKQKVLQNNYDLEDLPLVYANEREVRELKGSSIDRGVVAQIKKIEDAVYRDCQKVLGSCKSFSDIADVYEMNKNNIQVSISREKDWYMIYEEREDEIYIGDIAMINGMNSQGKGERKTEVVMQTLEMYEAVYKLMLESAKQGKTVRLNATEDTSYINIMNMAKKGFINIIEDSEKEWNEIEHNDEDYEDDYYEDDYYDDMNEEEYYDDNTSKNKYDKNNENSEQNNFKSKKIMMHDIVLNVNKEKMEEELKRIKARLEKRKEKRIIDKAFEEK